MDGAAIFIIVIVHCFCFFFLLFVLLRFHLKMTIV